jgi:hypothetical protein
MSETSTSWKQAALGIVAAASILCLALGVASANQNEAAQKQHWQKQYEEIIKRADAADIAVTNARAAVREQRQRDRPRGEARAQLYRDLETAEAEFGEASKLLADFPEQARLAGVPAGWLREVEERMNL